MNWPKELNELEFSKIKKTAELIESDDWFERVEVIPYSRRYYDTNNMVWYLGRFDVFDRSENRYYLSYENEMLTLNYSKISNTGKTAVRKTVKLNINNESFLDELKSYAIIDRQTSEYMDKKHKKELQAEALTSIIIDGVIARYPKVKTAFDARHRGAKNFLEREFKKGKLVINAKLTVEDRAKLDKLFQVLDEMV